MLREHCKTGSICIKGTKMVELSLKESLMGFMIKLSFKCTSSLLSKLYFSCILAQSHLNGH